MPNGSKFPPTRWSVIDAARSTDPAEQGRALETLFAAYWKPVYKYVRLRWNRPAEDAQDLTQGFFAELLERELLAKYDPAKSRLRTYLRLCVDSFVMNQEKAAHRQKRGACAKAAPAKRNSTARHGPSSARTRREISLRQNTGTPARRRRGAGSRGNALSPA